MHCRATCKRLLCATSSLVFDGEKTQVRHVFTESLGHGRTVMVGDIVLAAHLLDHGLEGAEMAVVDGGEEVVLNLKVEPTGEEKDEPAVDSERMGRQHLVLVVVRAGDIDVRRGQVVDLEPRKTRLEVRELQPTRPLSNTEQTERIDFKWLEWYGNFHQFGPHMRFESVRLL